MLLHLRVGLLATLVFGPPAFALTVDIPMRTREVNPCTGQMVLITGSATLSGDVQDVPEGKRFVGDVNYDQLQAIAASGDTVYQATGENVGRDIIRKTVSIPVDETITTTVKFIGPGQQDDFIAHITTQVSYGLFTGKSTEVTAVNTECIASEGSGASP